MRGEQLNGYQFLRTLDNNEGINLTSLNEGRVGAWLGEKPLAYETAIFSDSSPCSRRWDIRHRYGMSEMGTSTEEQRY